MRAKLEQRWPRHAWLTLLLPALLPCLPLSVPLGVGLCDEVVEEAFDLSELDEEEPAVTVDVKDLSLKKTAWAFLPACVALLLLWPRGVSRRPDSPRVLDGQENQEAT